MVSKILEEHSKLVDSYLKKFIGKNEPENLYEPIKYHIFAGGKRIRPVLCLLACEAVGSNKEKALPIAASLELVHAFTLVHDDIMDQDELRRGKPTLFKKYGEPLAINAGDGIFSLTYKSALNLDSEPEIKMKVISELTNAILNVCEGQALDITLQASEKAPAKDYLDMSTLKTASLISVSPRIGAMVGKGSEQEIKELSNYGEKVGLAFQIHDDYIDFASDKTGKTKGSDIKNGKKTLVVCHALENAGAEDRERLMEILKEKPENTNDNLIEEAVGILEKTGSIKYAKDYAEDLIKNAKESLKVLKDSEAKQGLLDFADFMVSRES